MGIVRDITVEELKQAVNNIDTSTLAQDSTLQDVVTAIGNISGGSDPVTNTTVNSLCKDTTGQSIASAISGLGTTLGSDRALTDGSNIANPSAFRNNIGLQRNTPTVTASGSNVIVFSSIAQIGNLVSGSIEITIASASLTVWQNVATIDVKPTNNVKFPAVRTGNGSHTGMFEINTDGLVRLFSTQSLSSNNVAFTFSYRTT